MNERSRWPRPTRAQLLRHPEHLLAFGFGTGYSPLAPGTVGSVLGVVGYVALAPVVGLMGQLIVGALAFVAGVAICRRSSERLGLHDHPGIVFDEIVGCYLTCVLAPSENWWALVAAFAAFRLFDISKPWPIRAIDHGLEGGLGIMLDDVAAALMAAISLHAAARFGAFSW